MSESPGQAKRWRVEMADKTTRTVEARGFRVEGGALILNLPAGCAAAFAPGTWLAVETAEAGNQ